MGGAAWEIPLSSSHNNNNRIAQREKTLPETQNTVHPVINKLAMEMARDKADVARWGVNMVIFLFAILLAIIMLTGQGVGLAVTAPLAVAGLGAAWLVGLRKGRRLYQNFYAEHLVDLQRKPVKEAVIEDLLSHREKEILSYIAHGKPNKLIASELGISEQTVKNHVTSVLRRLNARDRTEAVVIGIKMGLISIG